MTGTISPQLVSIWQKRDTFLQVLPGRYSPEYLLRVSRYVHDAEFDRSMLPLSKVDAPLLLRYQYQEEDRFDVFSITEFAACQDEMVYPDEISHWNMHSGKFKLIEVDGDHWFLRWNFELLMQPLNEMTGF